MHDNGKLIDFGVSSFENLPALRGHLARQVFIGLAKRAGRVAVVDRTLQRKAMTSGALLAVSWILSKRISKWTDKKRVGVLFPPGLGACVANLAVVFAGRIPVNLNFTLGESASLACIEKAGIDCIISAGAVRSRLEDFPWPGEGVIDLVGELKTLPKLRALLMIAAARLVPGKLLANLLGLPRVGDREEAALLFTSGSSGLPKGVVLTHRNILGNCAQIDASGLLPEGEVVMANLPVFHSFGFTVTLWYALISGCRLVTLPSPLDVKAIADVVSEEKVAYLIGTPTFFRPYFKRVEPEKLRSVRYVIGGAEKTPEGFHEAWKNRFGSTYLEGYGLTETSPVVAVNLPFPPRGDYVSGAETGTRRGSVGRMLPGHAARIIDPDTREDLPLGETGLLVLRGPNIFGGYLDEPGKTAAVMDGDWFITGDLARFDGDGFLFIEGRLSRFSKIGGEMVPHGTIEEHLIEAFEIGESPEPVLAIGARPDPAKGEALVLLTTLDVTVDEVRERLSGAGVANLWIPREIRKVDAIPVLATGKFDLQGIKRLAAGD